MVDKKKISLSRRKMLGGLGAIGLTGAGAGLGTSALFSDEETFENNSITAGTLDMTVSAEIVAVNTEYEDAVGDITYNKTADGAAETGFQLSDFKPGDWVIVCFDITIEDNPGYVLVQASDLVSDENGFEEPEPEDGASNGEGELDDKLLTTVWDDYDDSGDRSGLSTLDIVTNNAASSYPDPASTGHSWGSPLRDEDGVASSGSIHYTTLQETYDDWFEDGFLLGPGPGSDASKIGGPANDQESKVVYLLLEVPVEVGNEIQGDSVSFDLEWRAQQVRNNDNPFPGPVINARTENEFPSIQDAVNAAQQGDTIQVREGASFDENVDIDVKNLTLEAISNTKPVIEKGVDILADGVTVDGFEVQNPGTQGGANPGSPGGRVGIDVSSGNEDVSVLNNDITEVGTSDDDANPIGVLASDGTSGITVEGNEISNLEGTDEDQAQVQGVLINESGTQITDATVNNNTITDLLDTRSTNAIRFNGDVKGEIIGNTISDLNTEGDIPGTNDPGGFTQVIALQRGGGSTTGPSDVTIQDNGISEIETTTPDNFAPPVHIIVGPDASDVTITENDLTADSQDTEVFVEDRSSGSPSLNEVLNDENNVFNPEAVAGENRIIPLQTESGGLFANLGTDGIAPLQAGTKLSEFPTGSGDPFGLDGEFMQPIYANKTDESISIDVVSNGFGPTSLELSVGPYNESAFTGSNQWTRIPTGSGTPYPLDFPETAWDNSGDFQGGPISGGPDGDYELVEVSETPEGFKIVWEYLDS